MTTTFQWKFPNRTFVVMRIEKYSVGSIALLVFFLFLAQFNNFLTALIAAAGFIAVYVLVSYIVQMLRRVEEHYHIKPPHLHITRQTKYSTKKEKIHLKEVKHHKLDKYFLGGYLITVQGRRHALFFNDRKEMEKFEKELKRHLKPVKKS